MQERLEMQQRQGYQAVEKLRETLDEKYLWEVILLLSLIHILYHYFNMVDSNPQYPNFEMPNTNEK